MKKPKMRKMKSGEVGISQAEFNKWLSGQLKSGIPVHTYNTDPNDAFFVTDKRMTRRDSFKIHGIVYVLEGK